MKYLFLMGGSGSGKTTLAMKLESIDPSKFKRTLELSTREIRNGEVNGFDYKFVTDSEYDKLLDAGLFESVEYQFAPARYGAEFSELDNDKWNIVIVCIEGFMSALRNVKSDDHAVLVNIISDVNPDIDRAGRNPKMEDNINKSILVNLYKDDVRTRYVKYVELNLSLLKEIRNNEEALLEYFGEIL